jgi:hypothetical protein
MDWTLSQMINETERLAKSAAKMEASKQTVLSSSLKHESIEVAKLGKKILTADQFTMVRASYDLTKEAVLSGKGFDVAARSWTQTRIKLNQEA